MKYASKDIRNILVAGHAGCGKTTLTEALLYMSGATERMGRVEDGTTASDFDPEEIRRKASLGMRCPRRVRRHQVQPDRRTGSV